MSEFKDKTILITGSSRGIGAAITKYFLAAGANVHGISQSQKSKKKNYTHWKIDLSDFKSLENWFVKFFKEKSIDILINNAGIYPQQKLLHVTEEKWNETFTINVKSLFFLSQMVANNMKDRNGGVIINAASYPGLHPSIGSGVYAASKTAIISLTKSMAAEWAPYNIRVNSYSPGFILTDMTAAIYKKYGKKMLKDIALKRYGKPEEIAEIIGFFCSKKASYITGENIKITGGKFLVQNQESAYEKS